MTSTSTRAKMEGVRDDWIDGRPPPEAYSRVTNPERFGVLHDAADAAVTRLADEFAVDVERGVDVPGDLVGHLVDVLRTVRVDPGPGAAPVVIVYTAFPGLAVRWGHWCTRVVPACGRDACDDDPVELADEVGAQLLTVADGGLREVRHVGPSWVQESFTLVGAWWGSDRLIGSAEERRRLEDLGAGEVDWRPWTRRPSGAA